MDTPDRPKLRPGLAADAHGDHDFVLYDPRRVGQPVVLSPAALALAERFDGQSTAAEICAALAIDLPGVRVSPDAVAGLAAALDDAGLLDSPRLRARFTGPVREPTCVGSYAADPDELRAQLTRLFTADGGPGLPGEPRPGENLRAVLAPHMDYGRGGVTYGHAFKELVENSPATVFVIVGTSHYSPARFTLSRQHFATPLGVAETDTAYVDRVAAGYGDGAFGDPLAHVPEHSIELEVVLLQFLLGGRRPFRIVPLLTGSIEDRVREKADPAAAPDLARMVDALRAAEAACPDPVCYLISGDLAHIGPKFGHKRRAAGARLAESREKDRAVLKTLEAADPGGFFEAVAAERDRRNICGLSPAWLTLAVTRPRVGRVLHYQQFADPRGRESVSFAAAAFYG
ncbi:MAG: AmmeMemoRadiSam system protein B [Isosphaera sp.]|nr:AmmeMemoRadiSam system protein B [Isosphaera sp.]